jgi:hypothetical protein
VSKSYRGWAEAEDWSSGRAFKRPSKRKSEQEWKRQAGEEIEEMATGESVFIITNEWTPEGSEYDLREIVDNQYFDSEDLAWEALNIIAETLGVELDFSEVSVDVPSPASGISDESYYIEELNHG